ncbi:folylpolyglutamate synthase/dihydrofolate synthase family protein [Sphingosinicella sp. YJ22]|uniref:bifunctional folylpolyglutamate synthase/dihydrofolate synthase n=1 Tax=Sphingosinicella sp. YJ22 TaxID=1104780 RepID=UPI001408454C|nr:folylpolyglutamate synthase/dihydrofolate synthase family protein [Sphingosinicella sp. YJ22]
MPDFAVSDHPGVQAQLDRLARLGPGRDTLGLERIATLLERLGNPERKLPPVFHVAGTNGKGSTCAFLRAALEAAGHQVHVYTSPHLVRFNERIRLAGKLIEDEALAALLDEVFTAAEDLTISFFEVTTAAALLAFSRAPADACVIEVGLGGRLDATNVIPRALVTGIAQLGLDHQAWLGEKIEQVAREKAGIARDGVPLVTHLYPRRAADAVAEAVAEAGALWLPRGGKWDAVATGGRLAYRDSEGELDLPLPRLAGTHQGANAGLAVAMLRHQDTLAVPPAALKAMMGWADWPARLQLLGPGPLHDLLPEGARLWLDGAHNPAAARAVAAFLDGQSFAGREVHLVCGILANKDSHGVLRPFAGSPVTVHPVPVPGHDHHAPESLAAQARKLGLSAVPAANVEDALTAIARLAKQDRPPAVLIMGSLYLAGTVLKANDQLPT